MEACRWAQARCSIHSVKCVAHKFEQCMDTDQKAALPYIVRFSLPSQPGSWAQSFSTLVSPLLLFKYMLPKKNGNKKKNPVSQSPNLTLIGNKSILILS